MEYFYIDDSNKQQGPLNLKQLKEKGLKRTSKVWCEGMLEWKTAADVNELKKLFTSPPPVDSQSATSAPPPVDSQSATSAPPPVDSASVSNTNEVLLASEGDRFLAYFIDALFATVLCIFPILGWMAAFVYILLADALPFLNGQSFGKKAMKIRVVKQDTYEPITEDYGASALRKVSLMIPIFSIVDACMVFGKAKLRFGDQWAKTTVIKER